MIHQLGQRSYQILLHTMWKKIFTAFLNFQCRLFNHLISISGTDTVRMLCLTDSDYTKENYNVNIVLKSFEWRIQFFLNNASYNIISELKNKSGDMKFLPVALSLNYNLDLISAFHFHYHWKRVLFVLLWCQIKLTMFMTKFAFVLNIYYFHRCYHIYIWLHFQ